MTKETPKIKFITRRHSLEHLDGPPQGLDVWSILHVAEQSITPNLPEWRKMPYCRNGGLNLKAWRIVELDPLTVHTSHICRNCLRRMRDNNVKIPIGLYTDSGVWDAETSNELPND